MPTMSVRVSLYMSMPFVWRDRARPRCTMVTLAPPRPRQGPALEGSTGSGRRTGPSSQGAHTVVVGSELPPVHAHRDRESELAAAHEHCDREDEADDGKDHPGLDDPGECVDRTVADQQEAVRLLVGCDLDV